MLTVLTCIAQIASCPISYDPQNPVTSGMIASRNPNFNIPYEEQQNLLSAVKQLYQGNVSFVIVKVNGGGTNLPGF
jgi:flagellar basal body rod protein FlgC